MYHNVKKPRFFVNILEYLFKVGIGNRNSAYETLPVNAKHHFDLATGDAGNIDYHDLLIDGKSFYALLGHNFGTTAGGIKIDFFHGNQAMITEGIDVNSNPIDHAAAPEFDGFSIGSITPGVTGSIELSIARLNGELIGEDVGSRILFGSCIIGNYYDLDAPDIDLKIHREYGSPKTLTSINGSEYSNSMWRSQPAWGMYIEPEYGNLKAPILPWNLHQNVAQFNATELENWGGDTIQAAKYYPNYASGRRSWDLSFSYMSDNVLNSSNELLAKYLYTESALNSDDTYDDGENIIHNFSIKDDDRFFSRVWHKTLGGTIPFIFQPDSENSNQDQFAICKFKENSMKISRTAYNIYDISLSIEEVW